MNWVTNLYNRYRTSPISGEEEIQVLPYLACLNPRCEERGEWSKEELVTEEGFAVVYCPGCGAKNRVRVRETEGNVTWRE